MTWTSWCGAVLAFAVSTNALGQASAQPGGDAAPATGEAIPEVATPSAATILRSPHADRLLGREVSASLGVLGSSFAFVGGRWGDLYTTQDVEARWLLGSFTLEAGVLHALPLITGGASQSLTGHLRAGWTTERLTATVGLSAQYAFVAQPQLQYVPTLRAAYAFDRFGLSAGVFDMHALAIARVSVELGDYGMGYIAPLGAEAHARFRLGSTVGLKVQALAFRAAQAQVAFVAIGGVWDPDGLVGGAP